MSWCPDFEFRGTRYPREARLRERDGLAPAAAAARAPGHSESSNRGPKVLKPGEYRQWYVPRDSKSAHQLTQNNWGGMLSSSSG